MFSETDREVGPSIEIENNIGVPISTSHKKETPDVNILSLKNNVNNIISKETAFNNKKIDVLDDGRLLRGFSPNLNFTCAETLMQPPAPVQWLSESAVEEQPPVLAQRISQSTVEENLRILERENLLKKGSTTEKNVSRRFYKDSMTYRTATQVLAKMMLDKEPLSRLKDAWGRTLLKNENERPFFDNLLEFPDYIIRRLAAGDSVFHAKRRFKVIRKQQNKRMQGDKQEDAA